MKGTLLTYLLQFFSGVIIVAIILMSSTIITYHVFKRNWINSKLQAETLSSIISTLSSSSFNYTLKIYVGRECNIQLKNYFLNCSIESETYSIKPIIPSYIVLNDSQSYCYDKFLVIKKEGDKIWLE